MKNLKFLDSNFFKRATLAVAKDLIGKEIVRNLTYQNKKIKIRSRIVETEAYLGEGDPASHSSRGMTKRNEVMFGPPGMIYVYFIYGNYEMLNFVTEKNKKAGAVLIRAVEPIEGEEWMVRFRKVGKRKLKPHELTSGPAKLTMAMQIDRTLNGKPIGLPHLAVVDSSFVSEIVQTTRIGISEGKNLPYRFYEKSNPYVSRK